MNTPTRLAVASALGLALITSLSLPQSAAAAVNTWQRGVSVQPRSATDFSSAGFQQSINKLAADNANYVTLVIPVHQSSITSTDVQTGGDTPTDQSLSDGINYIHSKGMKAALVLHDDPWDGQWRAFINPGDRAGWFANYGSLLNRYASLAQTNKAEELIIGTELVKMTDPRYSASNTSNWQGLIQNVRTRFSGLLTYSAQHSGDVSDASTLGFWGSLDSIGLSAYYGLGSGTPSVEQIKSAWQNWNTNVIQPLATKYNKPVLFTEVGYQSKDNSLSDPGSSYNNGGGANMTIQDNAYRALFEYWNNYSYMSGAMLWDWSSDPNAGGTGNNDYTPQGKPAEQTMKQWFGTGSSSGGGQGSGQTGGSTTPAPAPTPTPTPAPGKTTYAVTGANSQATVNSATTLSAAASASQPVSGALVDFEVYNAQGQRVLQKFYDNQNLTATAIGYSFPWTPAAAGTYTVKAGIFTANWQANSYWNDTVATVAVAAASPATPAPAPSQPTTPPTTPMPTPSQTAALAVWWPGDGVTVSGVQPFKAVLSNTPAGQYTMYWQVDGGQLNQMADAGSGGDAHKESAVDLTSWNWNPTNRYTVTFVAKSPTGAVIATKSVVVTVAR